MRRILVTGANGQLGNAMRLLGATSRNEYRFTDVAELDITDEEAVRRAVCDGRIDVIVNCAAYTNVDRAEEDEATADRINRLAVGNLARAAAAADATLIHVSTDYVFSGDANRPYDETCETHPLGVYGRTKLAGEAEVEQSGCKSLIIRTAWLYSEFGHNFLKTMLRLTAERDRLTVVFDQAGTPTYAGDLARTIFDIVESGAYAGREGIYHFSNEGVCSWYDFAHAIAADGRSDDIYRQIGEAVPPLFACGIASFVLANLVKANLTKDELASSRPSIEDPVSDSFSSVIAGMKVGRA